MLHDDRPRALENGGVTHVRIQATRVQTCVIFLSLSFLTVFSESSNLLPFQSSIIVAYRPNFLNIRKGLKNTIVTKLIDLCRSILFFELLL